MEHESHPQ
jgi:hypothetical protein